MQSFVCIDLILNYSSVIESRGLKRQSIEEVIRLYDKLRACLKILRNNVVHGGSRCVMDKWVNISKFLLSSCRMPSPLMINYQQFRIPVSMTTMIHWHGELLQANFAPILQIIVLQKFCPHTIIYCSWVPGVQLA